MTGEQFRQMLREEMEALLQLHETKGRDYAGEGDALRHLKEHAAEYAIEPEQVWAVFAGKHWAAILTAVRHAGDGGYDPSEPVEGRILDLILYLFLLLALEREGRDVGEDDEGDGAEPATRETAGDAQGRGRGE